MIQRHPFLAAACAAVLLSACTQPAPAPAADPLVGKWNIDMEETIKNAHTAGLPPETDEEIRKVYGGGTMEFTPTAVTLRIAGIKEGANGTYKTLGNEGGCKNITIKFDLPVPETPQKMCITGNKLEVHDAGTPLVLVYRRG
jgi:hypothetical protein